MKMKKFLASLVLATGILTATGFTTKAAEETPFEVNIDDIYFATPVEEAEEAPATTAEETPTIVEEIPVVEPVSTVEEIPAVADPVIAAEPVAEETPAVEETTEEVLPVADATEEPVVEEAVEETVAIEVEATVLRSAPAPMVTPSDEEEVITGELVGPVSYGYAVMSDGSEAYCVEKDNEHVDSDAQYERVEEVDGSQFNSVFAEIAKADEAGMDATSTRQVAQLAIWKILNPESSYELTVKYDFADYREVFNRMLGTYNEADGYTFEYHGYAPLNRATLGAYQRLISGRAYFASSEIVEPEPEEPVIVEPVPEEPIVEEPIPEEPVVEEPTTPPVLSEIIETPTTENAEVTPTVVVRRPEALSWTTVPQTGDNAIPAVWAIVIFVLAAGSLVAVRKIF